MKKIITITLFLFVQTVFGQSNKPLTRILFVFDSSQSMWGAFEGTTRIDVAKTVVNELIDSLRKVDNIELALRVYGHQKHYPPQDCDDSKLEVPFMPLNHKRIKDKINELRPSGTTPIAMSLIESEKDFPDKKSRNIIILITDGKEECGGDPCKVSAALQSKNIVLKPFVIGIGLDNSLKSAFDCIGKFYDARDTESFRNILNIVISQALNNTSAQVNILDRFGKPTETNLPFTLYNTTTGLPVYNYVHTLNAKGNPDTLYLDPLVTYRLVVHTIPAVEKTGITLTPGIHNTIGIDAPTGYLLLALDNRSDYGDLKCIVRQANYYNTLNVQSFGTVNRYLTGLYDLEVLTLPRTYINKIEVSQNTTTTIKIPKPGIVTIISSTEGYGAILQDNKGILEHVCNLNEYQANQTITLQPGRYKLVYRRRATNETLFGVEKSFVVEEGKSTVVSVK